MWLTKFLPRDDVEDSPAVRLIGGESTVKRVKLDS